MWRAKRKQTINGVDYQAGDVIPADAMTPDQAAKLLRFGLWIERDTDTPTEPRPPAVAGRKDRA